MSREITNSDDVIDSRDVIARIEELEGEREELVSALEETSASQSPYGHGIAKTDLAVWDESEGEELKALQALASEGESLSDWKYGVGLIRESYFEDHARELAVDIGAVSNDAAWPCTCIDWERAARELQMDYTSLDFDGVTYYARG